MLKNPLVTLVLGLMFGIVVGYMMAESQAVPPPAATGSVSRPGGTAGLPEGHPPIDGQTGGATAAVERQVGELRRLLEANPGDVRLMVSIGNLYFDAENWPQARIWYERALESEPGDPDVLTDLAVVYRNLQQPERALELLDRAVEIRSDHWQAWYNRVVVLHFDLHRHEAAAEALGRLETLAESDPSIPDLTPLRREVVGS